MPRIACIIAPGYKSLGGQVRQINHIFYSLPMPRKPRIYSHGALYRVMLRGHTSAPVFFDESDRCRVYILVQEGAVRFGFPSLG